MNHALHRARRGFTLVEIMVVVAIIALLVTLGVPNYFRARKRSQATRVLNDLRLIDGALEQYAIDKGKSPGSSATWTDIQSYLKTGTVLYSSGGVDVLGNSFGSFQVDSIPVVPDATYTSLSDMVPAAFWSPYR
jgi:prepilin-type N-terminal cleavage/methylation domain-containing protein